MTGKTNTNQRGETYLGEHGSDVLDEDVPAYRGVDTKYFTGEYGHLADSVHRESVSWRPEEGDVIVGEVAGISEGQSEYGAYPLVEIDTPDGMCVLVHAFHAVLASELERRKPQIGDRIAIRYAGRRGAKDMAYYTVKVEHRTPVAAPTPVAPRQLTLEEEPF